MTYRWHTDPRTCSHANADVCPTCDFDGYYAAAYADCPWREESDGGWVCDHEWLDRPESDTRECLICGVER